MTLAEQAKAHDPALIAETVYTALTARAPAPAYSVKPDPGRAAMNLLPDRVTDTVLQWVLGARAAGPTTAGARRVSPRRRRR